jgi:hypothetical protein
VDVTIGGMMTIVNTYQGLSCLFLHETQIKYVGIVTLDVKHKKLLYEDALHGNLEARKLVSHAITTLPPAVAASHVFYVCAD